MNKKLLKTITGLTIVGAALGAAFAYVKKCKEVNDLGEEDFDDLWDDEKEKNPQVSSCTPCRSYTTIPSDTPVPEDNEEEETPAEDAADTESDETSEADEEATDASDADASKEETPSENTED